MFRLFTKRRHFSPASFCHVTCVHSNSSPTSGQSSKPLIGWALMAPWSSEVWETITNWNTELFCKWLSRKPVSTNLTSPCPHWELKCLRWMATSWQDRGGLISHTGEVRASKHFPLFYAITSFYVCRIQICLCRTLWNWPSVVLSHTCSWSCAAPLSRDCLWHAYIPSPTNFHPHAFSFKERIALNDEAGTWALLWKMRVTLLFFLYKPWGSVEHTLFTSCLFIPSKPS